MAKKKPKRKSTTVLTRNGQYWTEAQYWNRVTTAFRKAFSYWRPAQQAMKLAECGTRTNPKTGKEKKIYRCAACGGADYREEMQIDHIEPCGSLRSAEDVVPYLARLTCEDTSKYQVLHKKCHQAKTNETRRPVGKPGQYEQVVSGTSMSLPNNGFVPPGKFIGEEG